jgi:hypothetical protein
MHPHGGRSLSPATALPCMLLALAWRPPCQVAALVWVHPDAVRSLGCGVRTGCLASAWAWAGTANAPLDAAGKARETPCLCVRAGVLRKGCPDVQIGGMFTH